MRLKKLSIYGFKSFASKVVLNFDLPLIAVVGPNGCGKSNIVDALRWVMGEQSARSLRGEVMQDLLFAGAKRRSPANYAEVSLTITDIKDELPIDYAEITVTRRLHRQGESEFFINKNPVRLKDIQSLFMGSGIGKNAFSVFEQGKLDQVIHLDPHDRRTIFDEAAGTSRFLMKKKESLKKLEQVDANLERMQAIYEEVQKQTRLLSRQAAQAKSYQENATRLIFLQKSLLIHRHREALLRSEGLKKNLDLLNQDIESRTKVIQALEERQKEGIKILNRVQGENVSRQKQIYASQGNIQVLIGEKENLENRIKEIAERTKNLKVHQQELFDDIGQCELEATHHLSHLRQLHEQKKSVHIQLQTACEKETTVKTEVDLLRKEYREISQKRHLEVEKRGANEREMQKSRLEAHAARVQLNTLMERTQKIIADHAPLNKGIEERKKRVRELASIVDRLKQEIETKQKESESLQCHLRTLDGRRETLKQMIANKQARFLALSHLKEEMEGFSNGAQALLKESKNPKSRLYGMLKELYTQIIFPEGVEKAYESALRFYAHTLVVETNVEMEEVLNFAHVHQLSDFSLFCLENCQTNSPLLAHLLDKIELVDDPKTCNRVYCVTKEGALWDKAGVYFSAKKEISLFGRQKELMALEKEQEALREEEMTLSSEMDETKKSIEAIKKEIARRFEAMRFKEMNLVQENFSLQREISDCEKFAQELEAISKKEKALEGQREEFAVKEKNLINKGQEFEEIIKALGDALETLLSRLDEKEHLLNEMTQRRQLCEKEFQTTTRSFGEVEHTIELSNARKQGLEKQKKRINDELETGASTRENLSKNIQYIVKKIEEQEVVLQEFLEQADCYTKEFSKWKKQQCALEKELEGHSKDLKREETERHKVNLEFTGVLAILENFSREFQDRFQTKLIEQQSEEYQLEETAEDVEMEIKRLHFVTQSSEKINMTAIDEHKTLEKRYLFLKEQVQDLKKTKKDLETILCSLDSQCRKVFRETFNAIKTNFSKNFEILFGGGEAELKYTDSPDILLAGIEIIAKPPGKQMKSISLLSGGEKCLTALALLFAIFEVKPAPFCILDEVDAPLDDSNIERFTNVLAKFIHKTQFIVVTHNKKTMSICDALYGVSMEERGVSVLISLAFETAKRREPSLIETSSK